MRNRMIALTVSALTASLFLTGCTTGSNDVMAGMDHSGSTKEQASAANGADQMFVMMMIPHHEQAVEMSDLMLGKQGIDPAVTELAAQIKKAQGPEIDTMKGWLTSWGMAYGDSTPSHDMGGSEDGMMTDVDMAQLQSATGADAEKLFLEGMIAHHKGAVEMAQTAVDGGKNTDVIALAQQVIDDQNAEIKTMQGMLASR